ncbi:MAG: DUF4143 domain-containing protein [Alistipes indistinctus]
MTWDCWPASTPSGIQLRIINGDKDINFDSVYENAVAQELAAHGIATYYYNNKKRGELDFVIALGGKVLPDQRGKSRARTTKRTAPCPIHYGLHGTRLRSRLSYSITTT